MNVNLEEIVIEHDRERQSFEIVLGDERAVLEYRSNKEGKIFLSHTEVPPEFRGKGIGEKLLLHVFEYIKQNGMRMIPVCPFVKAYLKKHPNYQSLMASGIRLS